ncbi:transposase [Streptomyces sp. NBC_00120]
MARGSSSVPLLPESLRGRKRSDDRTVLNGIARKLRTGKAWRDVPGRQGPLWVTLHTRFRWRALDGSCGLTSKIHLARDVVGRPLAYVVTGGKANDRTQLTTVMAAIRMPRIGSGRPPGSGLPRVGRQVLQLQGDPDLATAPLHQPHRFRAGRPGPQPAPGRQPVRAPTGLRHASLQRAQRRGTALQPLSCRSVA